MSPPADLISIVDADADLAGLLDQAQLERARREALTRVRRLSVGRGTSRGRSSGTLITAAF
jgi:hypothetical protein